MRKCNVISLNSRISANFRVRDPKYDIGVTLYQTYTSNTTTRIRIRHEIEIPLEHLMLYLDKYHSIFRFYYIYS